MRDILFLAGLLLLTVAAGATDWRLGCAVLGAILFTLAMHATLRGNPPSAAAKADDSSSERHWWGMKLRDK
jgi:hypothetical protein